MAQEVAKKKALKKTLNLKITVYQDPEDNLRFKADIKVNGWTTSFGGWLDRKYIIDYLNMDLQDAWAYLGFVERAKTEESRKNDLDLLRLHLEDALAHILAYEIAQDNVVTKEEICNRWWNQVGAKECAVTECAELAKEDFDACMEACKIERCGSKD
jgi:hypothetical protein